MESPEDRAPVPGAEPLAWFGSGRGGPTRFTALRKPLDSVICGRWGCCWESAVWSAP